MRVVDPLLLEGEPDGGGVTAPPPSDKPSEGQPQPDSASVPEEGASQEPAPELEEQPAPEGEGEPADELTEDDWNALYEKYPDRDPRTAAEKAAAQAREQAKKEAQRPETIRAADPLYRVLSEESAQAREHIIAGHRAIQNGELPENPDAMLAAMDADAALFAASERRGQIAVNRWMIEQTLGVEHGAIDESNPLQQKYGDLLTSLETAQQNAYRLRQQAVREYDPQKRNNLIARADYMDAAAVGDFYRQTIDLAHAKGEETGVTKAEKAAGKRVTEVAQKARQNGNTEAIAKARAVVAGGKAMSTASVEGKVADMSKEKILQRTAYGVDSDGNRVTEADRRWVDEHYPG